MRRFGFLNLVVSVSYFFVFCLFFSYWMFLLEVSGADHSSEYLGYAFHWCLPFSIPFPISF